MTFRTPAEAAELANNTVYGLAASIWSENINVALDLASQVKAGVVWVNCTNQFDAACGFGGYRESGYGREGGREGMLEYLTPKWLHTLPAAHETASHIAAPDEEDSIAVGAADSQLTAPSSSTSAANRRGPTPATRSRSTDARASCSAKRRSATAKTFATRSKRRATPQAGRRTTAHDRAQVIYYIAENMIQRRDEIAHRLAAAVGEEQAAVETDLSIQRIFTYAAWADKYDGAVHHPPGRNITIAMPEPVGAIGILAPAKRRCWACSRWCCRPSPWATPWSPCLRIATRSSSAMCISCSTPATCPAAW